MQLANCTMAITSKTIYAAEAPWLMVEISKRLTIAPIIETRSRLLRFTVRVVWHNFCSQWRWYWYLAISVRLKILAWSLREQWPPFDNPSVIDKISTSKNSLSCPWHRLIVFLYRYHDVVTTVVVRYILAKWRQIFDYRHFSRQTIYLSTKYDFFKYWTGLLR